MLPAHEDRSASLSLSEGRTGYLLLHCFAGCAPVDVLAAVGLTMAALFPERTTPTNPEERKEARRFALESRWAAALSVLELEACVVQVAAKRVHGQADPLSNEDLERLAVAHDRIMDAREVLRGR